MPRSRSIFLIQVGVAMAFLPLAWVLETVRKSCRVACRCWTPPARTPLGSGGRPARDSGRGAGLEPVQGFDDEVGALRRWEARRVQDQVIAPRFGRVLAEVV